MTMDMHSEVNQSDRAEASGILYPCYKSFDDLIDVERLKSLDEYVTGLVRSHATRAQQDYFQNEHTLDAADPYESGVREIWLSRTRPGIPYDYLDLDKCDLWERSDDADTFALLTDFIDTLPFKAMGRMLIIYDDSGNAVPAHRDHLDTGLRHDFIWFRTNLNKPFYVLNADTGDKLYVDSYSAWFDTVNQFHGSDASNGLSFSVRVDGIFSDELQKRIPVPSTNAASAAAIWAHATNLSQPRLYRRPTAGQ